MVLGLSTSMRLSSYHVFPLTALLYSLWFYLFQISWKIHRAFCWKFLGFSCGLLFTEPFDLSSFSISTTSRFIRVTSCFIFKILWSCSNYICMFGYVDLSVCVRTCPHIYVCMNDCAYTCAHRPLDLRDGRALKSHHCVDSARGFILSSLLEIAESQHRWAFCNVFMIIVFFLKIWILNMQ